MDLHSNEMRTNKQNENSFGHHRGLFKILVVVPRGDARSITEFKSSDDVFGEQTRNHTNWFLYVGTLPIAGKAPACLFTRLMRETLTFIEMYQCRNFECSGAVGSRCSSKIIKLYPSRQRFE